jgi:DTW domain-containing protein YfiP
VFLQHPRERDMPIGTAHMASLCLPNSKLLVGVDWENSSPLRHVLSDPKRRAVLLYPSDDAIDMGCLSELGPLTLVVVDGTWSQTKKMVRKNPVLDHLPRLTFKPPKPSEYRIRREPKPDCVSTIEALTIVLGALEGGPDRFAPMLVPFRKMIDWQIERQALRGPSPSRHIKKKTPIRLRIPRVLVQRKSDIVCVVGEANAWPWRSGERRTKYSDELVHWVAQRPFTGETFECLVAPKNPLAPNTPRYVALNAEQLEHGASLDELHTRWARFLRDTDVVCSWGCYATSLLVSGGGVLPSVKFDLRALAKDVLKRSIGTLDRFLADINAGPCPRLASGRAGLRLGQLVRVAQHISAETIGQDDLKT